MKKFFLILFSFILLSGLFWDAGFVNAASITVNWNKPSGAAECSGGMSCIPGPWVVFHHSELFFASGTTLPWQEIASFPDGSSTPFIIRDRMWSSVASDSDGSNLIASAQLGRLYTSSDSGSTWIERQPAGDIDLYWVSVASDSDGSNLVAAVGNGRLYTSSDYGATWIERQPAGNADKNWSSVASDSDGSNLIVAVGNGRLYTSSNSGGTWTERQPAGGVDKVWGSVASDSTGTNLIVAAIAGRLYTSSNSGGNWVERQPAGNVDKAWGTVASDSDGSNLIVAVGNGRLYTSSNSGGTWAERQPAGNADKNWSSVASDSDGSNLIASVNSGRLYTSSNSGGTWVERQPAGNADEYWNSVASDDTGNNLLASVWGGRLYDSSNSGGAWAETNNANIVIQPAQSTGPYVLAMAYYSEIWGGYYYSPKIIYNRVLVKSAADRTLAMEGTISATGCENVYLTPTIWVYRADSPIAVDKCPQGTIPQDGICVKITQTNNVYSTADCPTGSNPQDGICVLGSGTNTNYPAVCPDGATPRDGICIIGAGTNTIYSVADCPDGSAKQDGICLSSNIAAGSCGDSIKVVGEECDGTDSLACPGLCIAPGQLNQCKCPQNFPPCVPAPGNCCDGNAGGGCSPNTPPQVIGSTGTDYCSSSIWFGWTYTDKDNDPESRFQFQIDNNSDFLSPEINLNYPDLANPVGTRNTQAIKVAGTAGADQIVFSGTPYYWRVQVYDSKNKPSGWVTGQSFKTPLHSYPFANFTYSPSSPLAKQKVTFNAVGNPTNPSKCFGTGNAEVPCKDYKWVYGDQTADGSGVSVDHSYATAGPKNVVLTVTDNEGYSCPALGTINIKSPGGVPEWKEISPF